MQHSRGSARPALVVITAVLLFGFHGERRNAHAKSLQGGWEACTLFISAHGSVTVTPPVGSLLISLPHILPPPPNSLQNPSSHLPSAVASFSRYALPVTSFPLSYSSFLDRPVRPSWFAPRTRNSGFFSQSASSGGGGAGD